MFRRFPALETSAEDKRWLYDDGVIHPYGAFAYLLEPYLRSALERSDLRAILEVCAFLEDASEGAGTDGRLSDSLVTGIGEWLGGMEHEERLSPWLGKETKRVTRYVEGLATQRRQVRVEEQAHSFRNRLKNFLDRVLGRHQIER